jgi:Tfp pilus assembly protein PilV
MKIKLQTSSPIRRRSGATERCLSSAWGFTLIEAIVATFVSAIVLAGVFAAMGAGFSFIQVSRENLRANQIILQRMEAIRLTPFTALATAYPPSSTDYFNPGGQATGNGGAVYTVTYNCNNAPVPIAYTNNTRRITVTATWTSGKVQHTRSMQTYATRFGIQRYVSGT